jgi:hypothetical protein
MVSNFLIKYGTAIGKNDTILVGSANQLLKEGLEGYASSLLDTMDRLVAGPRRECRVLPAPFFLLSGCNEPLLLKNMLDLHAWIRMSGLDPDGVLNDTFGVIEHTIKNSPGETMSWSGCNFKLPVNLPSRKKSCVAGNELTNLPIGVGPLPEHIEKLAIGLLLNNLK